MSNINIIYENENILALDKPAGVIVNRAKTHSNETVQDFMEEEYNLADENSEDEDSDFISRSGIVHRLDKDTSGVLLAAKNSKAFDFLQKQFKNRTVQKEYLAIVSGAVEDDKIEINAPIGRNPRDRFKYAIVANGKPAVTRIEKVKLLLLDNEKYTLLRVFPKTGRTHQIRVHLAAIRHPVANDPIYSSRLQQEASVKVFNRMMLHALSLTFIDPTDKKTIKVETVIPEEFNSISDTIK